MIETKGKILLSGFNLDEAENAIVSNIIRHHVNKIRERTDFDYLKLRLRKIAKGKTFLHEIEGSLKTRNQIFASKSADYNLFSALAEVMEKLLNELRHRMRTQRQRK